MSPRVSFTVTEEERREIQNYVKAKKRWRDAAALARDAVWQMINRNQAGAHRRPKKGMKTEGMSRRT